MKIGMTFLACAAALLTAGCTVRPALPVAALHLPPPILVAAPPAVLVAPGYHREHPGHGWGHRKHHD